MPSCLSSVRSLLLIAITFSALLALPLQSARAAAVYSTFVGGWWTSTSTWQGGQVPTSTDDVHILGPVMIASGTLTVADLTVASNGGSLTGGTGAAVSLTATGDVQNDGTIAKGSRGMTLYTQGDFLNNSSDLTLTKLYLDGNTDRTLTGTFPVSVTVRGAFALTGDPVFSGPTTAYDTGGAQTRLAAVDSITITSATVNRIAAPGGTLFVSGRTQQVSGDLTAATVEFAGGVKSIANTLTTITGDIDVLESATLRATGIGRTLVITGTAENHGTLSNDSGFTVKVAGDILNYSNGWAPGTTELTGSGGRTIGGFTPIGGNIKIPQSLTLNDSAVLAGPLTLGTTGTSAFIAFPSSVTDPVLELTNGDLSGQGGLTRGRLRFSGTGTRYLPGSFTAGTVELAGGADYVINASGTSTITGNINIEEGASLRAPGTGRMLVITGNVENHGTLSNNYALIIQVAGDILNYSQAGASWANVHTSVYWPTVSGATSYQIDISSDHQNWTTNYQSTTTYDSTLLVVI